MEMEGEREASISERIYVLGRREKRGEGALNIGRYYALDGSLGSSVYLDGIKPHVITICGKRGYGKSYTMGVFVEEMMLLEKEVRKNIGIVVVDTLGIFWTLYYPNRKQKEELERWGREAKGFRITIFSSPENVEEYRRKGIDAHPLLIKTSELEPYHWAQLFNISPTSYIAAAIGGAVNELKEKGDYSINEMIDFIRENNRLKEEVRVVAENLLQMAKGWQIFDREGVKITEIVKGGHTTVLDVSAYPEELKIVVVALLGRKIFEGRVRERKKYEEAVMEGHDVEQESIPLTWMAIDEAHVFLPNEHNIAKDVLIRQWMRQGRQPGVSLLLATQRPSSLDEEVLSHSDIIISHRLTAHEDINALNRVRPTYMQESIGEAVKKIGTQKGVALIIDDTSEAVHVIKIRPRMSWHGGEEPSALIE